MPVYNLDWNAIAPGEWTAEVPGHTMHIVRTDDGTFLVGHTGENWEGGDIVLDDEDFVSEELNAAAAMDAASVLIHNILHNLP